MYGYSLNMKSTHFRPRLIKRLQLLLQSRNTTYGMCLRTYKESADCIYLKLCVSDYQCHRKQQTQQSVRSSVSLSRNGILDLENKISCH